MEEVSELTDRNRIKVKKIQELYKSDVPPRACSVYLYLFQRCYNKDSCFPTISTICSDMKLSRSTVKRAITDLEEAGFIIRVRRYRDNGGCTSNLYVLAI